jgi:hypothetical protein
MKPKRYGYSALAVASLIGVSACAQSTQPSVTMAPDGSAKSSQQPSQSNSQAPEGWVLVREQTVVLTANEPQNHLLRAQQLWDQKDMRQAAGEVRTAATYLDMQASRGQGEPDQQLSQQADHLRQLADQIAPGAAQANSTKQNQGNQQEQRVDEKELRRAFTQANCALAQHLQSLAKRENQNHRQVLAGHDLASAADSLDAAFVWSGEKAPSQTSSAIADARQYAARLLTPSDQAPSGTNEKSGQAQTAAARSGPNHGAQNVDASKAIDELGNAIQQARGTLEEGGTGKKANG